MGRGWHTQKRLDRKKRKKQKGKIIKGKLRK